MISQLEEYQQSGKMIRYKTKTKEEFCQSRFYKDWNPDNMADYNRYADHNCNFPSQRGQLSYCKCNNSSEDITSDSHYLIQLNSILALSQSGCPSPLCKSSAIDLFAFYVSSFCKSDVFIRPALIFYRGNAIL